jgi:hypothetical protein
MGIHDPKTHTAAIGIIGAVVILIGVGVVKEAARPPAAQNGWTVSSSSLQAVHFGAHSYVVFQSSGSGDLPGKLISAIKKQRGSAELQSDLLVHEGLWLSPNTDEGHMIAKELEAAIGEPVQVGNADNGAFEIGVGRPTYKEVAP